MKKTHLLTSVAILASLGLVGCGGGSGSTSSKQADTSISGTAIDPELRGATVCLDINRNNTCDTEEPTTLTDENGKFILDIVHSRIDGNYPLLVINGIDKESGKRFKGKLSADINSTVQNITPLTTLLHTSMPQERGKIEKMLGLTIEEMQENIITLADEKNRMEPLKIALVLQKSAEALSPQDPIVFYENLSENLQHRNTSTSLKETILSMTPLTLQMKMDSFLDNLLDASLPDAYALASFARDEATRWGVDLESILETLQTH